MSNSKKAWEVMRINKEFTARQIMREPKDYASLYYLNALERTGYIVQKEYKKTPWDREYMLVMDTGENAPVYQTSRTKKGKKYPAMVKDKNIGREYYLEDYPPIKKVNPLEAKFLTFAKNKKKFTYSEALEIFRDESHPKGYRYSLFHYYLEKLKVSKKIIKNSNHEYTYNFKNG